MLTEVKGQDRLFMDFSAGIPENVNNWPNTLSDYCRNTELFNTYYDKKHLL